MSGTARQHMQSFIYRLSIETNVNNMQHRVTHQKTDKIIVTLIHERNKTSSRTKNYYFMEDVEIQTRKQPTNHKFAMDRGL